jgi:hypothetical protein
MGMGRWFTLAACVLMCGAVADARVGTITQTLDYTDNWRGEAWYFWDPGVVVDHSPYHRHAWEDWGWTHDLSTRLPTDVNSIVSATLSILAWDVDDTPNEEGEIETDIVYANGVDIGLLQSSANGVPVPQVPLQMYGVPGQPYNAFTDWSVTVFTLPPKVLGGLALADNKLNIFVNIDRYLTGDRVTIASSTLELTYTAVSDVPQPNATVYRFWSPVLSGHFYTVSEDERDYLIANFPGVWTYEGVAYRAFDGALDANVHPIYRFWSNSLGSHFYTISDEERDYLVANYGSVWTFEGIAWYAYPEGLQPPDSRPVYRFWSDPLGHHFYTISEEEKQYLIDTWSAVWTYEGIAWYAYP